MFDHCSVSRIKIILWGSREEEFNEVAKLLVKRISTKFIYSEIVSLFDFSIKSVFSDYSINKISDFISNCDQKQIHIILFEELCFDNDEQILLNLKRLFYFASFCCDGKISFVICGFPNKIPVTYHSRNYLHDAYNYHSKLIIKNCGINNIFYFDTDFLVNEENALTLFRFMTAKGRNIFVQQLKVKLNYVSFCQTFTRFRRVYLSYPIINEREFPLRVRNCFIAGRLTSLKQNFELVLNEVNSLSAWHMCCDLEKNKK